VTSDVPFSRQAKVDATHSRNCNVCLGEAVSNAFPISQVLMIHAARATDRLCVNPDVAEHPVH